MNDLWQNITHTIQEVTGDHFNAMMATPLSGGCINDSFRLQGSNQTYFVKINSKPFAAHMFACEAHALEQLGVSSRVAIPRVICAGVQAEYAFLVLEYLELTGSADWTAMAEGLAQIHQKTTHHFGWYEDNFIGSAQQINTWQSDWESFWWHCRLEPQLSKAARNFPQEITPWIEKIKVINRQILAEHQPKASLVHGDLWSGNVGFTTAGRPTVFDPACYYGDRETDLAMTRLFGGFGPAFYRDYERIWPLPQGYEQRFLLYNLYHLLNHLNLFGPSYLRQCLDTAKTLQREP